MTLYQHKAGARFLSEFTDRTTLRIKCRRCPRNQRLTVKQLRERYLRDGETDIGFPDLASRIPPADCENRKARFGHTCFVYYPDLLDPTFSRER